MSDALDRLHADVVAALESRGAKRQGDELRFRCLVPGHEDRNPSAAYNVDKRAHKCLGCGADGGLIVGEYPMASLLGFNVDDYQGNGNAAGRNRPTDTDPPDSVERFARTRGLEADTLEGKWRLTLTRHWDRPALRYPTARGVDRIKFVDGNRPKYTWAEKGGGGAHWYGLPGALDLLGNASAMYVVNGEPAVWAAQQHGVPAVCLCAGEGAHKAAARLADDLRAALPSADLPVRVVFDADESGSAGGPKVAAALASAGIDAAALQLRAAAWPNGTPREADVGDLAQAVGGRLAEMLAALPEIEARAGAGDAEAPSEDLSHDSLALELGETRFDNARYVDPWNRWYFWGGSYWQKDESLLHMTRSREFLRDKADELEEWAEAKAGEVDDDEAKRIKRWAKRQADKLKAAHTVAAVVGLARSNAAQAESTDTWDRHHYLMGTTGRTLDLRTGKLRDARQDDYITKAAAVEPAPDGTSTPLWDAFLDRIMDGNVELIEYLQRFAGYCLTGSIEEHVFAFGHGGGANGKDTFIGTIQGILGDYAQTIPVEALMVTRNERHPTEIARLRGVRLAVGSETERGKRWAESRIKSLTGGGRIAARFMRADYFEFDPAFKLFVHGNHKPSLYGVDEAIRRRLHLIPFTVTIPPAERDKKLRQKLEDEWPGIFRWAVDGCLEWQRRGLDPPESVVEATDEYLHEEDTIGRWLADCCDTEDPQGFASSSALYDSWTTWAEAAGEYVISKKRLGQELAERGFDSYREPGTGQRGYIGLTLQEDRG